MTPEPEPARPWAARLVAAAWRGSLELWFYLRFGFRTASIPTLLGADDLGAVSRYRQSLYVRGISRWLGQREVTLSGLVLTVEELPVQLRDFSVAGVRKRRLHLRGDALQRLTDQQGGRGWVTRLDLTGTAVVVNYHTELRADRSGDGQAARPFVRVGKRMAVIEATSAAQRASVYAALGIRHDAMAEPLPAAGSGGP